MFLSAQFQINVLPSLPLSPHTSPSTVGSGCCPRDERWRSGFLHAERHTGPTSRRLSPWWLYPWPSGPQPPGGGYAQLPSMCICMQENTCVHKGGQNVSFSQNMDPWFSRHSQCEFAVWLSGYVFACNLYAKADLLWSVWVHVSPGHS